MGANRGGAAGYNVTGNDGRQYNVAKDPSIGGWRVVHTPVGDQVQINTRNFTTKHEHL